MVTGASSARRVSVLEYDSAVRELAPLVASVRSRDFAGTLERFLLPRFDPQSVIILLFENRRRPQLISQWIPDPNVRAVFEEHYFDYGYFLDPFFELAMSDFEDGAFRLGDIAPDRFFRSAYCRRYYRQTRMVDELGCLAKMGDNRVVHLSLGRNEGSARFRKKDEALLRSLAPVLMQMVIQNISHDARRKPPGRPRRSLKEQLVFTKLNDGKRISKREAEVASLIIQGHSSAAIGLVLSISPQTVKVHRRNIYRKLGISSQSELFAQFMS